MALTQTVPVVAALHVVAGAGAGALPPAPGAQVILRSVHLPSVPLQNR